MNFLIDAQLPRRLVYRLRDAGHDATIITIAIREDRIIVTKDADFVNTFDVD